MVVNGETTEEFASAINLPENRAPVLVSVPPMTINFPSAESSLPFWLVSNSWNSSLVRMILALPLESVKNWRPKSEIPSLLESNITKALSK